MKPQLKISLIFALSAFSVVWLFAFVYCAAIHQPGEVVLEAMLGMLSETPGRAVALLSCILTICWTVNFVKAVVELKLRGLWLLAILPVAWFWPVIYLCVIYSCAHDPGGCAI